MAKKTKSANIRVNILGLGKVRKLKPRGDPKAIIPYQFKKGLDDPRRYRGGKPKIFQRFDMQLRALLLEPAPETFIEAWGLCEGCTTLEALVRIFISLAATGDLEALKELAAMTDGRSVSKSGINIGIANYMAEPGFQQFLTEEEQKFRDWKENKENKDGSTGNSAAASTSAVLGADSGSSESETSEVS